MLTWLSFSSIIITVVKTRHTQKGDVLVYNFHGITFHVSDNSKEAQVLDVLQSAENRIQAIKNGVAYNELPEFKWSQCDDLMREFDYGVNPALYRVLRNAWQEEDAWNNQAYRDYTEADFREYASHKNEPDFDWDFYSDWHKDLYGFRPHH